MHTQNFFPTFDIGPVGGGDQNDAFVRFESVHLNKQGVQRLLALVVPATETGAAMASHRVDFVDEDDARSILLSLLEKNTHAARANAHKHFDEVRTRNGEEWHIGFSGDCAR